MGLDEFLIPRDPSPATASRPLGDLGEVLLAPPIDLDASEGPARPVVAPPLKTALIESPPQRGGLEAEMPSRVLESTPALADVIVAASPTVEAREGKIKPAESESIRSDDPKPLDVRPSAMTFETSKEARDFLAETWDPTPPPTSGDVGLIDDEYVSTSPPTRVDWGAIAPANSLSTIPGRPWEAPSSPSSRSTLPLSRWEDGFPTPTNFGTPLGVPSDGPDFGDDLGGVEGRLSQVVDRLERAVERLATPSPPLGSRPRPFRGRIDG